METVAGKVINVRFQCKDGCKLYGQNVGDFPKHHFSFPVSQIPPENWALQVSFAGPDETVRGFWRARENSDLFSLEFRAVLMNSHRMKRSTTAGREIFFLSGPEPIPA